MALTLEEKTRLCALAADSRKANEIVVLDVQPLSSVADRFLICNGASDRQVKAIVEAITDEHAARCVSRAGCGSSRQSPRSASCKKSCDT